MLRSKKTMTILAASVVACGASWTQANGTFEWDGSDSQSWTLSANWTRIEGTGIRPCGAAGTAAAPIIDIARIQLVTGTPYIIFNNSNFPAYTALSELTIDSPDVTFKLPDDATGTNLRTMWLANEGAVDVKRGKLLFCKGSTSAFGFEAGYLSGPAGTATMKIGAGGIVDVATANGIAVGLTGAGVQITQQDGTIQVGVTNLTGVTQYTRYMQALTIPNGFTNNGTIRLSNTFANWANLAASGLADSDTFFTVTNGPLVNGPAGKIEILKGASDGTAVFVDTNSVSHEVNHRDLVLQLDNRGLLDVQNAGARPARLGTVTATSHTNSGTIAITAATTLQLMASNSLTNQAAGKISGKGTLDASLGSFANDGELLPGGAAATGSLTINGTFANSGTAKLSLELGSASAYDQLVVTSGTATLGGNLDLSFLSGFTPSAADVFTIFSGAYSGTFANTPANKLTLAGGYQFNVTYGTNQVTLSNYGLLAAATEWKTSTPNQSWSAAANWTQGVPTSSGDAVLGAVPGADVAITLSAPATVGKLTVDTTHKYTLTGSTANSLAVNGNVELKQSATLALNSAVLVAQSLTLASGTKLDVNNSAVVVNYTGASPLADIRSKIMSARNVAAGGIADGSWDGNGITSSAAAAAFVADGVETKVVAYAENALLPFGAYSEFAGQTVGDKSVLVKFTRNGDTNLDGVVDDIDATIVGALYDGGASSGHQWYEGDFNFDGLIDDLDATILGAFYDPSAAPLSQAYLTATYGEGFAKAFAAGQAMSVPEPATLSLLGISAMGLLARRRQR